MLPSVVSLFLKKLTIMEYVCKTPSWRMLTELGGATWDLTAASTCPVKYCLKNDIASSLCIFPASQTD